MSLIMDTMQFFFIFFLFLFLFSAMAATAPCAYKNNINSLYYPHNNNYNNKIYNNNNNLNNYNNIYNTITTLFNISTKNLNTLLFTTIKLLSPPPLPEFVPPLLLPPPLSLQLQKVLRGKQYITVHHTRSSPLLPLLQRPQPPL